MNAPLLTPDEVAQLLRCSKKTLFEHVRAGTLPYVNVGRGTVKIRRMFAAADVEAFIARQTHRDMPPAPHNPKATRRRATAPNNHTPYKSWSEVCEEMEAKKRERAAARRKEYEATIAATNAHHAENRSNNRSKP